MAHVMVAERSQDPDLGIRGQAKNSFLYTCSGFSILSYPHLLFLLIASLCFGVNEWWAAHFWIYSSWLAGIKSFRMKWAVFFPVNTQLDCGDLKYLRGSSELSGLYFLSKNILRNGRNQRCKGRILSCKPEVCSTRYSQERRGKAAPRGRSHEDGVRRINSRALDVEERDNGAGISGATLQRVGGYHQEGPGTLDCGPVGRSL